jgi:hypothetical protein
LIYESAVPVSQARHGDWSVEIGADYSFSRSINSVPLMAVEFPNAHAEYPIVFAGSAEAVMPAVVLGLRADQNLYITADNTWQAKYIPAFVRRYPFVFSSADDGKTFHLCIDEKFKGFNREGRGERLFNDERKPTPYVENVMKFLQQYQLEFRRTQEFCRRLKELNLLQPMRAQVDVEGGQRMTLTGFWAVERARLKTLSAATLAELAKSDELELVYTHLMSMRNFADMRGRMGQARPPTASTEPTAVPTRGNGSSESDSDTDSMQDDAASGTRPH